MSSMTGDFDREARLRSMSDHDYLSFLRTLGVWLVASGDRLGADGPPGVFTSALRAWITQHKSALLRALKAESEQARQRGKRAKRRPGLALSRHQELGQRLYELQRELTSLAVEIANAEGSACPAAKKAHKLESALSTLRSELEEAMFRRYPGLPNGATRTYYRGHGPPPPLE